MHNSILCVCVLERPIRLFRLWLDAKTSVAPEAYCHARGLARSAVRAAKNDWFCRMASVVQKGRFGEMEQYLCHANLSKGLI